MAKRLTEGGGRGKGGVRGECEDGPEVEERCNKYRTCIDTSLCTNFGVRGILLLL